MSGPVLCHAGMKTPVLAPGHLPPPSCQKHSGGSVREAGSRSPYSGPGLSTRTSTGGLASQALFPETTCSLTSSHSEANEGDFSSLFFPMLQLDRDSLRLPIVASSVGEQVRRSESDLDKLRLSLSSALGLLVGGARLLAPLGSPSSSAPPGRGEAVRVEVLGCVWLWAWGRLAGWPTLLLWSSTRGGEAPDTRLPVCSSCISSGQAPCTGDPSRWFWPGAGSSWRGSCPASHTGEEPWRRPENCSGTCPSCPSAESWLRPPLLRLWSWSGRRDREITKLNAAKINKVPMQQAHGRAEEFRSREKGREAGWLGSRQRDRRGERKSENTV